MNFNDVKAFIKKHLPTQQSMQQNKYLRIFGKVLWHPYLWKFNHQSIARGVAVGLFAGYMLFPVQPLLAVAIAVVIRANVPIAAMLVVYSNPFTAVPLYYFAYRIGCLLLKIPEHTFGIHLTWHWLVHEFLEIWQPLLLGTFICGLALALVGYLSVWAVYWLTPWHKKAEAITPQKR